MISDVLFLYYFILYKGQNAMMSDVYILVLFYSL